MKSFYEKDEYSVSDIESLISTEAEESIYLEFKESASLEKNDVKRKEISKDVSAFANSDGGIIIYGLSELNHKASDFSFVNGNEFTKEWIEQVINSTIQRHIPDLRIYPLRINGEIEKSIYIVKIPKSNEAPHLSKDRRFYKRFNFESVSMEEYEIRQLYGRKTFSKLALLDFTIGIVPNTDKTRKSFRFEAKILNEGDVQEKDYKINVYFNDFKKEITFSWDRSKTNYDYTWIDSHNRLKLSAVGFMPIFPKEQISAIRFDFEVPLKMVDEILSLVTIEVRLLYPNGESKLEGDMKSLLGKLDIE